MKELANLRAKEVEFSKATADLEMAASEAQRWQDIAKKEEGRACTLRLDLQVCCMHDILADG